MLILVHALPSKLHLFSLSNCIFSKFLRVKPVIFSLFGQFERRISPEKQHFIYNIFSPLSIYKISFIKRNMRFLHKTLHHGFVKNRFAYFLKTWLICETIIFWLRHYFVGVAVLSWRYNNEQFKYLENVKNNKRNLRNKIVMLVINWEK